MSPPSSVVPQNRAIRHFKPFGKEHIITAFRGVCRGKKYNGRMAITGSKRVYPYSSCPAVKKQVVLQTRPRGKDCGFVLLEQIKAMLTMLPELQIQVQRSLRHESQSRRGLWRRGSRSRQYGRFQLDHAYGQTGSGKPTITGGAERYVDRGIIPRALSYIQEIGQKLRTKDHVVHKFMENTTNGVRPSRPAEASS